MDERRQGDQERLYELLTRAAENHAGLRRLSDPHAGIGCPSQGVYFFFEAGEIRANGSPRVVRVGTHAVTRSSKATLWERLRQHRGSSAGRHPGGGNHRGSIFRRHTGASLIARDQLPQGLLDSWLSKKPDPAWAQSEADLEVQVSRVIGAMPFLWVPVADRGAGLSDRGRVERNSIALLSQLHGSGDQPSETWLGRWAPRSEIRGSGLWNVNHVDEEYDPTALDDLASYIA